MKFDKDTKILIVGLGLIGGSYAMALKKKGYRVCALTKDIDSIEYALENGIIDEGTTTPSADVIGGAELIICALYPHVFLRWLDENKKYIKSGTLITDVTGVKQSVVYDAQSLLSETGAEFIAAHPMAGREVYGVWNATDEMFKEANYIVVPTENNSEEAAELCEKLGWELGFKRVSRLSPAEHDEMIAFLSQLTHCIAVALMCANGNEKLVAYTGDSFRDLTRIARINDDMWSELFLMNKKALLSEIDCFSAELERLREYICVDDKKGMQEMMRLSTERRKYFDK